MDDKVLLLLAMVVAVLAGILATAPSLSAGLDRLKLLNNLLGLAVVFAVAAIGLALLVWGLISGRGDLVQLAVVPLLVAGVGYQALTRGRRRDPVSGDNRAPFWQETRDLWQSVFGAAPASSSPVASASADATVADRAGTGGEAAPAGGPSLFMFGAGQIEPAGPAGHVLERALRFIAHRLADRRVSVFPESLQLAVVMSPAPGEGPAFAGGRPPELSVRRRGGAPLMVWARTDVPFLEVTVGRRRRDGSYPIVVGLVPQRLVPGPFAGTIEINTGDSLDPRISVPVGGMVG
jgi:hypothetical protein